MKYRKQLTEHEINTITQLVVENSNWKSAPPGPRKPDDEYPPRPIDQQIPQAELDRILEAATSLWKKYGLDIDFTKHFIARLHSSRDDPPVTVAELTRLFRESARYHGERMYSTEALGGIVRDLKSNVNITLGMPEINQPLTTATGKRLTQSQKPKRTVSVTTIMRNPEFKLSPKHKDDDVYVIGQNPEDHYYREPGTLDRIPVRRK